MSVRDKSRQFEQAARAERLRSPQTVQKTNATRYGGGGTQIRKAYCKTAATETNTIEAYLDEDGSGQEITVICHIATTGADALNKAVPRLTDGFPLFVAQFPDGSGGQQWECITPFIGSCPAAGVYCAEAGS